MQQYIVRRALLNVLVIFMVITMVFLGLRLTPGDFAVRQAGAQIPQHSAEEAREIVRHDLGLDKPMPKQYWEFVSGLFQGDLGDSFVSKEPVMLELDMGRLLRPDTINPRSLAWANPVSVSQATIDDLPPNRLGAGERSVIGYARTLDDCVAGLDDLRARQLAEAAHPCMSRAS